MFFKCSPFTCTVVLRNRACTPQRKKSCHEIHVTSQVILKNKHSNQLQKSTFLSERLFLYFLTRLNCVALICKSDCLYSGIGASSVANANQLSSHVITTGLLRVIAQLRNIQTKVKTYNNIFKRFLFLRSTDARQSKD